MSRNRIEDFGPYQDALCLFDHVVDDMEALRGDPRCYRLIGQQVGSSDSICANMEKGFGRLSRTEFIRFLDISRGSARETLGRYKRLKHWIADSTIAERVELIDRIIARLTKSINTLRSRNTSSIKFTPSQVRESGTPYEISAALDQDDITDNDIENILQIGIMTHPTPDTRHPTPDTRHPTPDTRHPTRHTQTNPQEDVR